MNLGANRKSERWKNQKTWKESGNTGASFWQGRAVLAALAPQVQWNSRNGQQSRKHNGDFFYKSSTMTWKCQCPETKSNGAIALDPRWTEMGKPDNETSSSDSTETTWDRVYKARFNLKTVTVELTIKNHTNVVVSCIYRTPGSPIDKFCENLELNLSDVKSIKTIFVCGDFNIGLLKHEKHNNTKVSRHNV